MPRWLLHSSLRRAAFESLLITLGGLLVALALGHSLDLLWIGLGGMLGGLWAALRLRLDPAVSLRTLADDTLIVLICSGDMLVLSGGVLALAAFTGAPAGPLYLFDRNALVIVMAANVVV